MVRAFFPADRIVEQSAHNRRDPMKARNLLLAAGIAVLAASLAQADERNHTTAAQKDWDKGWDHPRHAPRPPPQRPGAARVLDLSTLPAVIDAPGTYVLNRDWDVTEDTTSVHSVVDVLADDVVIDFRGFEVNYNNEGAGINIQGANVTVRNGRIVGFLMSVPILSTGVQTTVENMYIQTFDEGPRFEADGAILRESTLRSRFGAALGSNSVVERNFLECSQFCLVLGSSNQAVDNEIHCSLEYCVLVRSGSNLVAGNRIVADAPQGAMRVMGDGNVLRGNTILLDGPPEVLLTINGSANVIDGNVAAIRLSDGTTTSPRAGVGIAFSADGNFYGNNRLAAVLLVAAGGTVQTDWGGNFAY
jgi:hypothetical protein